MRGENICLLLRKDVQVIVVLRGDLGEKEGIWGETAVGGRRGEGREVAARKVGGGGGDVMQEEEQKGDAKVREPRDQSMHGLCRDSHGNPSTN